MRMALALLDKIGRSTSAIHLQHAIDVAMEAPIPRTVEEAEAIIESPAVQRLAKRLNAEDD